MHKLPKSYRFLRISCHLLRCFLCRCDCCCSPIGPRFAIRACLRARCQRPRRGARVRMALLRAGGQQCSDVHRGAARAHGDPGKLEEKGQQLKYDMAGRYGHEQVSLEAVYDLNWCELGAQQPCWWW